MIIARRYRLEAPLGRGGSSTAWRAIDLARDAEVALKLLTLEGIEAAEAFRAEFARLAGLAHPCLVEVLDHGVARDASGALRHYTTAALVRGTSLADLGATHWETVAQPLADALAALDALHRAGIRHGDFKPGNVVARDDGRGVLIDLGAAAPLGRPAGARVSGTPRYLAPEVLTGAPLDARADLFAVGVTITTLAERMRLSLPKAIAELARALVSPVRDARPESVRDVLAAFGRSVSSASAHLVESPRFIGRYEVMTRARSALERVLSDEPGARVVAIDGSEGTGKTRLLREVKWLAQQRTAGVVEGFATTPGAVRSMLARASEIDALQDGIEGALAAHAAIVSRGAPVVLLLDDAGAIADAERATWSAFLRLLRATDPVLVVGVGLGASAPAHTTEHIELGPMDRADIAAWFPEASATAHAAIMRWSGGSPAALAELGRDVLADPDALTSRQPAALASRRLAIASLDDAARTALALLAVWDAPLDASAMNALGSSEAALWSARDSGLALRDHGRWRLARGSDAGAVIALLPEPLVRDARARVLRWLDDGADAGSIEARETRRAELLVDLGDTSRAAESLARHRASWLTAPRDWMRVASRVIDATDPTDVGTLLLAAEVLEVAGEPSRSMDVLARAEPLPGDETMRARLAVARASCAMKLGRPEAAVAELDAMDHAGSTASVLLAGRAADLRSRALIKLGRYEAALASAEGAVASEIVDAAIRGDLLEDIGVACSYLGRHDEANRALGDATAAQSQASDPRREARALMCWAIDDYRAGRIESAIERYRRTLALAEQHRLTDLVASSSLNLGSALHQRGEWGEAMTAYARGGRLAAALGQTDVAVVLAFDLAKLHVDLGSFGDAEQELVRARELAAVSSSRFFSAACDDLDGELRVLRDGAGGAAAFRAAEQAFVAAGATREATEVRIHLAELAAKTDVREARRWIDVATADSSRIGAPDLDARIAIARAVTELAAGNGEAARKALESVRSLVSGSGMGVVGAELDGLLAEAWERDGAELLAAEHRQEARLAWERTAAGLPASLRHAFWQHPKRRGLDRARASGDAGRTSSRREAKLERLLAVNRLLASTLETDEVLRRTMDAAIELTGAERGFIILARGEPPRLEVAVARNVDRERVGRSHLKFSHSIAERVIETGEAIITADAASDDRFSGEESVHAMRLRSVAAVPIRGPEDIQGALYLDNRFQPSRFDVADVDLLLAFADQVAIALRNAAMHEALVRRTEELEREKGRVEDAFRGQVEQIEALAAEVRTSREALAQRYEYGEIVAGSAAMRRVLGTLDRVIESGLSVLVQGESGTGKELVARAIHVHSPRAAGPFVGINCAALPESLLESELFGHVKGAFTGADKDRPGLMVAARGGTLFLDEIGEMPLSMQAKLLRALQEREVRPIGAAAPVPVDFRLVCATNRVLRDEAERGRFRQDLYYRIGVVEVTLPPLRERSEDIPALAARILARLERDLGRPAPRLSARAMQILVRHEWPGNVRELENALAKAVITTDGDEILPGDLDVRMRDARHTPARKRATERDELLETLKRTEGHAGKAARALGVSRATFYRRLAALGITR